MIGEQPVGEIIDLHLTLETILCDLVRDGHYPSIKYETVQLRFFRFEGLSSRHDAVE